MSDRDLKPAAGVKTPFQIAAQETACTLMLFDITRFTLIANAYSNQDVTDFLCRFHVEMENIVKGHPGADIKHESGDSFWVFTSDSKSAEELGNSLVAGYNRFIQEYEGFSDIVQTSLRFAHMPARVISYDINGERHYNSKAHVDLRRIIEGPH